jgi:hypothetical protein
MPDDRSLSTKRRLVMTLGVLNVHAHKLIAELCEQMANQVFDEAMKKNNDLYRQVCESNPGKAEYELRRIFVRWMAPRLVGDARATLAGMLPTLRDPVLQNKIYDALLADNVLRRGRGNRVQRRGFYKLLKN